ncbi:MAG: cation:proton antiporter [Bryobacteraceae bacterium]
MILTRFMNEAITAFPLAFLLAGGAEIPRLLLDMLLVFASAKLLAEAAERLKQPPVVGELCAGILIGPSVLGWVTPTDFLRVLAELGVMFLLFRVGLELKDFQLTKLGFDALMVAVLGVIVPFLGGWGLMAAMGHSHIESVFVGAALVATSVGITARVLAGKGLLQERASKLILAAAIIDDVLGLLVLSVVSSMAKGQVNLIELASTAVLAIGFTFIVAHWGTRTMERIVPKMENRLQAGGGQFTLAIVLLFGLSLLAIHAGVAAIIGAFLAGMALANSTGPQVADMTNGVTEFLVPFFLAGIGLHLDMSVFRSSTVIGIAVAVLLLACASKFLGCAAGAWRLGWLDAKRIGVGMIPRGEVGMVVAQIGLRMGVIPPDVYGVVVSMSIGTTIVAPPLLKLAFRSLGEAPGKVRALPRVG